MGMHKKTALYYILTWLAAEPTLVKGQEVVKVANYCQLFYLRVKCSLNQVFSTIWNDSKGCFNLWSAAHSFIWLK